MIKLNSRTSLYLIGILLTAVILRLIALDQSFWLDEAAQAVLSISPFELGHFDADFQPPLSYYLTYVWMSFGNLLDIRSEWFLRLPMVAFGVGTVYLLYQLLKDMFNKSIGLLGGLLLATAPFHVYYSQEFRMYSMLTFFAVLSWYLLWHRRWNWLIVATTMGIFTHYFALINLVAQIVYVLLARRQFVHNIFNVSAFSMAPFILWLPVFIKQLETAQRLMSAWPGWENISNTGFIRFPGLVLAKFTVGLTSPEPKMLYGAFVGAFTLVALVSAGGLFYHWYHNKEERQPIIMLAAMFALPLLCAWFGGLFVSASSPWRIQFVLPAFYGLVAVGLWKMPKKQQTLGVILAMYLVVQNLGFTGYYLFVENNHREDWRGAVAYSDTLAKDGAIVLTEFTDPWAPMHWYSTVKDRYVGASSKQQMTPKSIAAHLDQLLQKKQDVVLYSYLFEISDPERLVEKYLVEQEYILQEETDHRGVGIIRVYGKQ